MPTNQTKTALEAECRKLNEEVVTLRKTIGIIKKEIGQITVPYDQAETMQKVASIIDKAIDRI
jgi:rRNA processing protein Gar1